MATCKDCFHKKACFKMLEEGMGFKIPDGYEGGADRCDTYIPTADVVEVVRCKECKLRGTIDCVMDDIHAMKDDDFCSYGERKDNDNRTEN